MRACAWRPASAAELGERAIQLALHARLQAVQQLLGVLATQHGGLLRAADLLRICGPRGYGGRAERVRPLGDAHGKPKERVGLELRVQPHADERRRVLDAPAKAL